jgi:hypothetical protein
MDENLNECRNPSESNLGSIFMYTDDDTDDESKIMMMVVILFILSFILSSSKILFLLLPAPGSRVVKGMILNPQIPGSDLPGSRGMFFRNLAMQPPM